jgi:endonuclease YncB( thermonuclease family)
MWDRRARVVEHHDGDSVVAILDQGFGDTKKIDVRLLGVYAPELKQVGGPETSQFVTDWLARQPLTEWPVVVTTARMKRSDREQTTLGRWVATVTSLDGSENLNLDVIQFVAEQGYGGGIGGVVRSFRLRSERRLLSRLLAA